MSRLQDEIIFHRYPKPRNLPLVSGPRGHGNRYTVHRATAVPASPFRRQRVTVKMHYTRLKSASGAASLARHRRYLAREGVGVDGKRPELFGEEGKDTRLDYLVGEPRYYRLILSPEHGEKLDMEAYTRRFMEELKSSTGRELLWTATVHYNTEHPHAHIVIRGLDAKLDLENPVYFPPALVRSGMRDIAERIATLQLGYRSEREVAEQLRREVTQERFTSIDRRISREVDPADYTVTPSTDREMARLDHLAKLGFARKRKKGLYELVATWSEDLKALGEKDDIIKNIYAETGRSLDAKHTHFYTNERVVEGRVTGKGVDNELTDSVYALIESSEKDVFYYTGRGAREAELGDRVRLQRGKLLTLEKGIVIEAQKDARRGGRER